ncbi:MAG: glycosyltransferase family 2 protein [Acidimicrobiales bacterium]
MRHHPHVKRVLRALGYRKPAPRWVVPQEQPVDPEPVADFELFAIVNTWMEADVIGASVHNAFAQGCERVLLVDNESPDDTVAEAIGAGAELARSYSTSGLDEARKIHLLNETVAEVSAADGRDHVWWLWIDADEFVHGPGGRTVRDLLTTLDRRFRIVGSRYFNHFPDRSPGSLPGFHPLDLQPRGEENPAPRCPLGHRKHHLQRWDRSGPPITCRVGFHVATAPILLSEPKMATFTHHFPYRLEEHTRARFDALCRRDEEGRSRVTEYDAQVSRNVGTLSDMSKRYRTIDHVYAGEWDHVENVRRRGNPFGVRPRPWEELVSADDARFRRWYAPEDLAAATAEWRAMSGP